MDAIGHALITQAISDDPLVVVSSAINFHYRQNKLGELRQALEPEQMPIADGIASHLVANQIAHASPYFHRMHEIAREPLVAHGVKGIFSHVAMEATIDYLLLEEGAFCGLETHWNQYNWAAAALVPVEFSNNPERARRNIVFVWEKPMLRDISYTGAWLDAVVKHFSRQEIKAGACISAIKEIAEALRKEKLYLPLIEESKAELSRRFETYDEYFPK